MNGILERRAAAAYRMSNAEASAFSVTRTIAARADLNYVFNRLCRTATSGDYGEALAQRYFLRDKLGELVSGKWQSLTPRCGSQGFDHLFVNINKGKFEWMVCESKWNTSQLGKVQGRTIDQMSWRWIHDRANVLGDKYLSISRTECVARKTPFFRKGIGSYDVVFENGDKVSFWQDRDGKWYYDGPADKFDAARKQAAAMGKDLKSPDCIMHGRKFSIKPHGNDVTITLENIESAKGSTESKVGKEIGHIELKDVLNKKISDEELKKAIFQKVHNKFPYLNRKEINEIVEDIAQRKKNGGLVKEVMCTTGQVALQALASGVIAGTMDAVIQLLMTRGCNARRVMVTAAGSATGTAAGALVSVICVRSNTGIKTVRVLMKISRIRSASMVRMSLSGGVTSLVTSAVIAYGNAWLNDGDWNAAHKEFASGAVGVAGGSVAVYTVTALIVKFGHASTGMAISHLSGAALTNAVLYKLGFGSVATGQIVLGAIILASTAAVSFVSHYTIDKIDEAKEIAAFKYKVGRMRESDVWDVISKRMIPTGS